MKKTLSALLALVLLLGMIPAATMEALEDEINSGAVDLPVPEEEVALGGGEAEVGEAAVSASNDDSYSMVHITRPTGYTKVRPGAEVEVWLRYDYRPDWDAGMMAANLSPTTVEVWKNDELIDTRKVRPGALDFSDEGAKYLTLTLDGIGVYEIRASVPYSRTEYSEARVYVTPESTARPEPTSTPELANPVGEGEKTVRINSPENGAKLSAGKIPIVVQLVKPASGDPGREAVEALYAPLDIMIYREGECEDLESRFGDELPDESFKPWSAYEFNAELAGAYEIRVCSREFEIWDSVAVRVDGPSHYSTMPESENPGFHIVPKQREYTVDLSGGDKTVRVEYRLTSFEDDDQIWRESHLDSEGMDCVEFADSGYSSEEPEYDYDSDTWYYDFWTEYAARKAGTTKLHIYAYKTIDGDRVRYDRQEILIHVIDSSATPEPSATPVPTEAPKADIAKAKVSVKNQVYTGKAIKPAPTVKLGGKTLKKGTDYAVSYKNNKAVGTATVTVKGKGAYTGTAKKTFVINPKAVTGLKLTAGANKLTVTWKKVGGAGGYEIQYGTKSSFSGAKTLTVKKGTATKAALKSLKAGKKYHVRIRAYRKVNKKTYYSAWVKASQKTK